MGLLPGAEQAVEQLLRLDRRFEPGAGAAAHHAEWAVRHRALRDAIAALVAS
jgi:hypothetical protein